MLQKVTVYVRLEAIARVTQNTSVEVVYDDDNETESDIEAKAEALAIKEAGYNDWKADGCERDTIQVCSICIDK